MSERNVVMISASAGDSSIPHQWFSYDATRATPLYHDFLSLKRLGLLGLVRAALRLRRERYRLAVHLNHAPVAFLARLLIGHGARYGLSLHRDFTQESFRNRLMLDAVSRLGVDALFANSRHTMSSVPNALRERQHCRVVYNGVDERGLSQVAARAALCRPDGTLRLIYIGRLEPIKNPAGAIRLTALLSERLSVTLELIGGGSETETTRTLAERAPCRVSLCGPQPHDVAMRMLANADAILIPSLSEGYCNVAVEAIALGRRIVYNNIPTLVEVVGQRGMTVDFQHPDLEAIEAYLRADPPQTNAAGIHDFESTLNAFAGILKNGDDVA